MSNDTLLNAAALAAPATLRGDRIVNQVLFVVALLSALGCVWVILSFAFIRELRTYRHQLILGLAISDFAMAVNFLISSGVGVAGGNLGSEENTTLCTVNGYLSEVFVVQTDWWILIIAIATYIILGNFSKASNFIQAHRWAAWVIPWFVSLLEATVCLVVMGYGYIGGWCWFTADLHRLVVNFTARCSIVVAITIIYIHLYIIVRNAGKWDLTEQKPNDEGADTSIILVTVNNKRGSVVQHSIVRERSPTRDPEMSRSRSYSQSQTTGPMNAVQLKRIAKKMMVYPLAYAIIWSCPIAIRIYQSTSGKRAPLAVTVFDKSCIVVQGFVDAIVYSLNERAVQGWAEHIRRWVYKSRRSRLA